MRFAFGLVALLIAVFIVVWMWGKHTSTVSQTYQQVKPKVQQYAGRDEDGRPATESATFSAVESGGQVRGLTVTGVVSGGAMQRYYGLQVGDVITKVGELTLRDYASSHKEAIDYLLMAYQRQQPIIVTRNGQSIELPQAAGMEGTRSQSRDMLQQQLDVIQSTKGLP